MKVKEESEKVGLKLNIQKTKNMASGPITSWEIDGETVETVSDFIFWAPKSLQMVITAIKLAMDREAWHGEACSWGRKELDTTEQLNWTELMGPDATILSFF